MRCWKPTIHLGAPITADELTACVGQKAWCHCAVSAQGLRLESVSMSAFLLGKNTLLGISRCWLSPSPWPCARRAEASVSLLSRPYLEGSPPVLIIKSFHVFHELLNQFWVNLCVSQNFTRVREVRKAEWTWPSRMVTAQQSRDQTLC